MNWRSRAALVGVAAVLVAAAPLATPGASAASGSAPYQDPSAVGYIGICDRSGHQITHGSITTAPFAWRAVSSVAAKTPYNESGRTAILLAYQPRRGVPAGEWSGQELTASARYSDAQHPMTAATSGDDSLKDFIEAYRPVWNGLLQIRMYLGAPDESPYSFTYPALDIQVTGNTWHAVDGGPVSCSSGRSVSIESIVLPHKSPKPHPSTHVSAAADPHHGKHPGSGTHATPTPRASGSQVADASGLDAATGGSSDGSDAALEVALIAGLVLIVAAGSAVLIRRRHASASGPSSTDRTHEQTPEKGR
jgi:hypothetical protein